MIPITGTYKEKRDFSRVKQNTALSIFYNNGLVEQAGMCCDLSDGGIGIETDKPISIGTQCDIKIHDGRSTTSKYQASIEVVRVKNISTEEDGERYHLGAIILRTF